MTEAEARVRSAWDLVHRCDGSYRDYSAGTILLQIVNSKWLDFPSWEAALAFTTQHKRKIADLEEEIDSAKSDVRWFAQGGAIEDHQQEEIHKRTLARLESALAKAKRGMR